MYPHIYSKDILKGLVEKFCNRIECSFRTSYSLQFCLATVPNRDLCSIMSAERYITSSANNDRTLQNVRSITTEHIQNVRLTHIEHVTPRPSCTRVHTDIQNGVNIRFDHR